MWISYAHRNGQHTLFMLGFLCSWPLGFSGITPDLQPFEWNRFTPLFFSKTNIYYLERKA